MVIDFIEIKNFRKLKSCRIDLSPKSTILVGANNSGKTSAMFALIKFLKKRQLVIEDFTLSNLASISILAPVTNPHKPIDTYQKKKHKIYSIIISTFISVIGVLLISFKLQYGSLMIVTLFTVAVMAKIEKTIQRRCSHNVKEEHC